MEDHDFDNQFLPSAWEGTHPATPEQVHRVVFCLALRGSDGKTVFTVVALCFFCLIYQRRQNRNAGT